MIRLHAMVDKIFYVNKKFKNETLQIIFNLWKVLM